MEDNAFDLVLFIGVGGGISPYHSSPFLTCFHFPHRFIGAAVVFPQVVLFLLHEARPISSLSKENHLHDTVRRTAGKGAAAALLKILQ